jgi:signal transduction histidine kinase
VKCPSKNLLFIIKGETEMKADLKQISKMVQMFDALYAAGHKPFDLALERLIALLRVSLALFCLIDIALAQGPLQFDRSVFELVLVAYTVFGLIVAWLPTIGRLRTGWQLPVHVIDIGVISYLMYFLQNISNTFFILYVFVLLSATFRWDSRGAIWTTILVFALQIILFVSNGSVGQFLIQNAFLFMIGGMFAFFGVGRERSANLLNQIAAWPSVRAQSYINIDHSWLDASLAHIATVLQVPRLLIVWEIAQEPYSFMAFFADGKCQQDRMTDNILDNLVSVELQDKVFASESVESKECFTSAGTKDLVNQIVDKAVQTRFKISSVCSAPFSGDNCKGRLFLLDRSGWGQDDLALTEIVASRLRIEIENYALCVQLEEIAASRERIRILRDLHDGSLQSLAAAALQLKMIASHSEEKVREEIDSVRRLILGEQRRIRAFVDGRQPTPPQKPIKLHNAMQREIKRMEQQWGCLVALQSITPQDATVSYEVIHEIEFLIAEAVSNAVQHGNASRINIKIERTPDQVQLGIVDNGSGLPGILGTYSEAELLAQGVGPQSICQRITELRGTLSLFSSRQGVELFIGLPVDDQAAYKVSDKAHAFS